MDRLALAAGDWEAVPVSYARTFRERWLGLKMLPRGTALLIRTSSVHSFGLAEGFIAVGLTAEWSVRHIELIGPNRIARFPDCSHVLELPLGANPPPAGARIELAHV